MQLVVNNFLAAVAPVDLALPFMDYPSWQASTEAKNSDFVEYSTWRYKVEPGEAQSPNKPYRLVFLNGSQSPLGSSLGTFDVSRFWRIGALSAENSLASHFASRQFLVEKGPFERLALRAVSASPDEAIELATGVSFSVQRPFRDDKSHFAVSFQWVVQAHFKESLASKSISAMAVGLPVLYKPVGAAPDDLRLFRQRFLGRVRSIENGFAGVMCKDDHYRQVPVADLRLEASPTVIKLYEQRVRGRIGSSSIIRAIQRLNLSLTPDFRRSLSVLRDRLDAIRTLLQEVGSSKDELIIPLTSFAKGSVSIDTSPMIVTLGHSL